MRRRISLALNGRLERSLIEPAEVIGHNSNDLLGRLRVLWQQLDGDRRRRIQAPEPGTARAWTRIAPYGSQHCQKFSSAALNSDDCAMVTPFCQGSVFGPVNWPGFAQMSYLCFRTKGFINLADGLQYFVLPLSTQDSSSVGQNGLQR